MAKEEAIEAEAVVVEQLPDARFTLELLGPGALAGHKVLAYVSGKMRRHFIRILPGDKVKVALSPYDLDKGRITYRLR